MTPWYTIIFLLYNVIMNTNMYITVQCTLQVTLLAASIIIEFTVKTTLHPQAVLLYQEINS